MQSSQLPTCKKKIASGIPLRSAFVPLLYGGTTHTSRMHRPLERFLQLTSLAVARAAASDPVLDRPPFFVADRPEMRLERYRSRIESTRSAFAQNAADRKDSTLLHDTAAKLAKTALGFDRTPESVTALTLQIMARLQWTSREIIG
jgi:hypothetical protein